MHKTTWFSLLFLFLLPTFGQRSKGPVVAKVEIVKGGVLLDDLPLKQGDQLREGDTLKTNKASFARISFNDKTIINIGSDTAFFVKSYRSDKGKRKNNLNILRGSIRVWVNRFAEPGEEINVNAQQISLGVRGTEFLVNAYEFGGAPSSDVLLVKGSLKASGAGFTSFTMEPGQFFNSQDLLRNGMKALKSLPREALFKVKESAESFIPKIQTPSGFLDLTSNPLGVASGAVLGLATSLSLPKSKDEKGEVVVKRIKKAMKRNIKTKKSKDKVSPDSSVKGNLDFKYNLKEEKWDIRDAVINREKNKLDNKCFYFFYKQLPGAGEPERFRRERDCDEFEYDL